VTTTPSGLQYKVIETGVPNSSPPRPTDLVTVKFRGTLMDGTEFDSSSKPGTASTLQANGVMKAWTQALASMKPGARWQLFVPPELGYGDATRVDVPGGSLLIYDLQLLSVTPAPVPPGSGTASP
jgi:FKBP-type peptidyl-prolyl cis-trans isomerase FklB